MNPKKEEFISNNNDSIIISDTTSIPDVRRSISEKCLSHHMDNGYAIDSAVERCLIPPKD